jgi:hypothetical protein
LDFTHIFLVVVFSGAGWVFFAYGRKQLLFVPILCGLALMIYPYFVSGTLGLVGIGAVLMAIPWFARR